MGFFPRIHNTLIPIAVRGVKYATYVCWFAFVECVNISIASRHSTSNAKEMQNGRKNACTVHGRCDASERRRKKNVYYIATTCSRARGHLYGNRRLGMHSNVTIAIWEREQKKMRTESVLLHSILRFIPLQFYFLFIDRICILCCRRCGFIYWLFVRLFFFYQNDYSFGFCFESVENIGKRKSHSPQWYTIG